MDSILTWARTVLLNDYFGGQFNSLNDVTVHPRNNDIYLMFGWLQNFHPSPQMPNQVYRFNEVTGAVTVVAHGFTLPNGMPVPEGMSFGVSGKYYQPGTRYATHILDCSCVVQIEMNFPSK